jgi:threonine dehydrogenase-like Zn-dependent dehydrogenase
MRIRAAVTDSKGARFAVQEVDLGELRPEEVLVRVSTAGICHTDLIIRDQWRPVPPMPVVLGHEGAGVVEAAGDVVSKVEPDDHVAMTYGSCGLCANCEAERPWVCHDFRARNFGGTRPDGSILWLVPSPPTGDSHPRAADHLVCTPQDARFPRNWGLRAERREVCCESKGGPEAPAVRVVRGCGAHGLAFAPPAH